MKINGKDLNIKNILASLYSRLYKNPKREIDIKLCRIRWNRKMRNLRKTERPINFVYVLTDLSIWKTEELYIKMLEHPRFHPILAITENSELKGNENQLIEYLERKGYDFIRLDKNKTIEQQIDTDMIIYQRPYQEEPYKHQYPQNKGAVMVHLLYGFHSLNVDWMYNQTTARIAWQDYYENESFTYEVKHYSKHKGNNVVVTGTPNMDLLFGPKEALNNPWKNTDHRKRIIWAPHHSIGNLHVDGLAYGTFLTVADDMLKLAQSYSKDVYFAFKPHPVLYGKLVSVWGQERTDNYYDCWKTMENAQFENGEYISLFKFSDAMIHDCATFTMEYLMTGKPAMFLVGSGHQTNNLNATALKSYDAHYHGINIVDVRAFIDMILQGKDYLKDERQKFVDECLRPPHNKTACENIINAILGLQEYVNV